MTHLEKLWDALEQQGVVVTHDQCRAAIEASGYAELLAMLGEICVHVQAGDEMHVRYLVKEKALPLLLQAKGEA